MYVCWSDSENTPEHFQGEGDVDCASVNSIWMQEFFKWINLKFPFEYNIAKTKKNFRFYENDGCEMFMWAQENLEGNWSFIYSTEACHFFFDNDNDRLKMVLKC